MTVAPSGEPLAEFSDRLLARLVDAAVYAVVAMVIEIPAIIAMIMLIGNGGIVETTDPFAIMMLVFGMIVAVVTLWLVATYIYEVELVLRSGQTVGKRVMKIRITSLDGSPVSRAAAARRWLAYSVAGAVVPGYSWVDGLWQLWDKPYRQCLHDKFAATVVVRGVPRKGFA